MINLLPPHDQRELAAARTNTLLIRYIFLLGAFITLLVAEITVVYVFLGSEQQRHQATIDENQIKTAEYAPIQFKADKFRSDLSTARYIFDKQVPYTQLILGVANALPNGVILDRLSLDPASFGTPTSITVYASSYAALLDTKTRLQSSRLFTDVNFQSVSSSSDSGQAVSEAHPFSAVLNVTFVKEAW